MKKLGAFTIIELIVVMIISIITMATIYTIYAIVHKQSLRQMQKSERLTNYLLFAGTFTADFNKADSIKFSDTDHQITCYVNTDSTSYNFIDSLVIRGHRFYSDSFVMYPGNLQIERVPYSELVKEFSVNLYPLKDSFSIHLVKEYDATCLIKYNELP